MQQKLRADYGSTSYVTFGGDMMNSCQYTEIRSCSSVCSCFRYSFGHICDQFWQIDCAQAWNHLLISCRQFQLNQLLHYLLVASWYDMYDTRVTLAMLAWGCLFGKLWTDVMYGQLLNFFKWFEYYCKWNILIVQTDSSNIWIYTRYCILCFVVKNCHVSQCHFQNVIFVLLL